MLLSPPLECDLIIASAVNLWVLNGKKMFQIALYDSCRGAGCRTTRLMESPKH